MAVFIETHNCSSMALGITNSFGDGSPGFNMYAPNSDCKWMIPRTDKRIINYLFTRFDLGEGDTISVFAYVDEGRKQLIRTYTKDSIPESVWVDAPYMLIEFKSDGNDEGFGFFGFYFDTFEKQDPVSIVATDPEEDKEHVGSDEKGENETFQEPGFTLGSTLEAPTVPALSPSEENGEEQMEEFARKSSKEKKKSKIKGRRLTGRV